MASNDEKVETLRNENKKLNHEPHEPKQDHRKATNELKSKQAVNQDFVDHQNQQDNNANHKQIKEVTLKMKLPELKENQKKKLIERFKQNKIAESFSQTLVTRVFHEMEIQDVMTYQDYWKKFNCITNAEDGLLPFE
jgi:hypothetical protein